jgi:hypothetical protein
VVQTKVIDVVKKVAKYAKAVIDSILEYMQSTWSKWDRQFEEEDKKEGK